MKRGNDHVNDFIKKYGEDFPGVEPKEIKLILNTPFEVFKDKLKNGELVDFRVKYLGVFKIYENKFKTVKKALINKFKLGEISEAYYNDVKKVFSKYEKGNKDSCKQ